MGKVFVLKRLDTGEYYQGNYHSDVNDRWNLKIEKAKKYKRKNDASNALTTMMTYTSWKKKCEWLCEANFVIQEYEMQLVNESYY
jgi:hypothetical protein